LTEFSIPAQTRAIEAGLALEITIAPWRDVMQISLSLYLRKSA
jgi:hypothetical protein